MPRSAKAGPARSRRRPDPSYNTNPSQVIGVYSETFVTPGAGTLDIVLQIIDPTNGNNWTGADWVQTGRPTNAKVVDINGVVHEMTILAVGASGSVVFDTVTGLPAGIAIFLVTPLDAAVRAVDGAWTGGYYGRYLIT